MIHCVVRRVQDGDLDTEDVNDIIYRALQCTLIPSTREPPGMSRTDGKRPDGMTQAPFANGKPWVWDVTCLDTVAISYVANTPAEAGSVAKKSEQKKCDKYSFLNGEYLSSGMAFETSGSWGPEAKRMCGILGKKLVQRTGDKRSFEFLRQRISVAIQRGNACSTQGIFPSSRGLDGNFMF